MALPRGTSPTASTDYFMKNYKEFSGIEPSNPAADRSYDAGAIVGLAIAIAGSDDPGKIGDAMFAGGRSPGHADLCRQGGVCQSARV